LPQFPESIILSKINYLFGKGILMNVRLLVCAFALLLAGCAATGQKVADLRQGQTGWVSFASSLDPVQLSGRLDLPGKVEGKVPVMIIAHASGGLDQRNERWAQFLQANGIATFVLDYFGPRGISANSASQPTPSQDLIDALQLLATHPRIDPNRIGVIGFSRGANMALDASNMATRDGATLAAHVALYPVCSMTRVANGVSNAPVLLLAAGRDDLAPPFQCEVLAERARDAGRDVTLKIYENACHGWDGDVNMVWNHPAAHRSYTMCTNEQVTQQSRQDVLAFLKRAFKL
jgi:dienelactone hydrolase